MKHRDILEALINLLADQEGVEITYIKESFEDGLLADGLIATNWVWAGNFAPEKAFKGLVKIRLASKPVIALIEKAGEDYPEGSYKITFEEKQRAIAPGQSAVVYINGVTVGGGIIEKAF